MAYAMNEFVQFLSDCIVLRNGHGAGMLFAALERAQTAKQIVKCARFLAVDIEHVEFGCRGIGGRQGGNRAVFVFEDQASDVRIVARQHKMRQGTRYAPHRTQQHFQHIDVMDADLQHHATRHPGRRIAP